MRPGVVGLGGDGRMPDAQLKGAVGCVCGWQCEDDQIALWLEPWRSAVQGRVCRKYQATLRQKLRPPLVEFGQCWIWTCWMVVMMGLQRGQLIDGSPPASVTVSRRVLQAQATNDRRWTTGDGRQGDRATGRQGDRATGRQGFWTAVDGFALSPKPVRVSEVGDPLALRPPGKALDVWNPASAVPGASAPETVLRRLLVQLGLGDDFSFWVKRVWKNWALPSASKITRWLEDDFDGYMNSLEVEQPVPPEQVECIRQNVCQRERNPEYINQEPKDKPTENPTTVDMRGEIKARAESILKIVSPSESISGFNLEGILSRAAEVAEAGALGQEALGEKGEPRGSFQQTSRGRETSIFHDILVESQKKARTLQYQELSEEELDNFAGLDCHHKVGQGVLDAFPRVVGPQLEVSVTEKDWERFLSGQ
ncbi:hypothetical protein G7Z17_g6299 [Cylindrodendrum hubeiense]|uniref:Uncharacterized protein n=1 Tax=Cylindrodendrum hubeiense TaxID=595255 RepID=A0A9P5H9C2_9HYPO|nr:hypothetical protein G7Z17_g6299 [Cylindrodendrum hubeiense]